jgi:hypothetical protein
MPKPWRDGADGLVVNSFMEFLSILRFITAPDVVKGTSKNPTFLMNGARHISINHRWRFK